MLELFSVVNDVRQGSVLS